MVTELVNIQIDIPERNKLANNTPSQSLTFMDFNWAKQEIVLNSHPEYVTYRGHGICTGKDNLII